MSTVQNLAPFVNGREVKGATVIIQVKARIKCCVAHLGPRNLAPDPVFSANPEPKFNIDIFGTNDA
jgi:hypothetical protein